MATPLSPETHHQHSPASESPCAPYPLEHTDSDPDTRHTHSPRTPSSASLDIPLLPDGQPRTPQSHTVSPNFVSSPLNPNAVPHSPSGLPSSFMGSRTQSRQNMVFNRIASEESQALTSQPSSLTSNRASMILYRLAGEDEQRVLSPPSMNRKSVLSNSGDSIFTVSYDSKYPSGVYTPPKLVPYPFDPTLFINTPEDDDALHDPSDNTPLERSGIPIRGFVNVGVLVFVISALLCLFIFYPVWHYAVQGNSTVP
ncbi:hypothetical protein JVT61DRAFT_11961 [Boletus reticuloceps]|uniref:Uncharacterized protein n=1 Tax=Boletus reticuloceps TaxID=495285 RepID=A0A8I3A5C5_9AGAM|nr:hypothetical protein JVT61DRAFT_15500 [Boletus reticuloceps]KAG6370475.1 hypothetical protein JVT61DRAFT_11961 [Boletus reticuloceps]